MTRWRIPRPPRIDAKEEIVMTEPIRLLLASGNAHKRMELARILEGSLPGLRFELATPADYPEVAEPEETGATFEANALLKARAWAAATGQPALADDSGLVVDALEGRPGVFSARYAATTDERNARVLMEMEGVTEDRRGARFVCVAALALPGGAVVAREGRVEGRVGHAPRGDKGFGYDPIFVLTEPPYAGRAMAELNEAEKNAISHRWRALAALAPVLAVWLVGRNR
jgi:XTP/dITP diphosphohydrolase